jgi:mannosyltransferase
VVVIAAAGALLARYHAAQPENYRALAAKVVEMERPGDLILLNIPEQTATFMDLYKGQLPMEGLNEGGPPLSPEAQTLLENLRKEKRRIWFVPNWLPPLESGPELWLIANSYQAESRYFDQQRLALYGFPGEEPLRRSGTAVFGERIALRGYAFPPQAAPGDILAVELYWEALATVGRDYHVFIHLVDQSGGLVAQRDGQPVLWTRPTSSWPPGEEIEDKYGVLLPGTLAPGPLSIRVGLYLPESGERLLTDSGEDFAELGEVTIR